MKERLYVKDKVDGQQHCISGDEHFYLIDVTSQYEPVYEDGKFESVLGRMRDMRGYIVRYLDEALEKGIITEKERDIFYFRHVDWNSLDKCGKEFGVTRERIRHIEAKVIEKLGYVSITRDK